MEVTVLRLTRIHPIPNKELLDNLAKTGPVIVCEEAAECAGIKEAIAWAIHETEPQRIVRGIDLGGDFVPHGDQASLYRCTGLDSESIVKYVLEVISDEE